MYVWWIKCLPTTPPFASERGNAFDAVDDPHNTKHGWQEQDKATTRSSAVLFAYKSVAGLSTIPTTLFSRWR